MTSKLKEIKNGNKIEVYDKNLISTLQEELNKVLLVEQTQSCFIVKVADDRDMKKAFKRFCKNNNIAENNGNALNIWLKEVKTIWV